MAEEILYEMRPCIVLNMKLHVIMAVVEERKCF